MRYKTQKTIAYLLTGVMVISLLMTSGKHTITAYATAKEVANLVLFVDFQDTDHSKHSNSTVGECYLENYETTIEMFDGNANTNNGMSQYLDTISYGQLKLTDIFPQYNQETGEITPFVASKNASEYADGGSSALLGEMLEQLDASGLITSDMDLDLDDDGMIDNVTLVAAYTAVDSQGYDIFVSHKASAGGAISFGNLKANNYNLVTESGAYLGLQQSGLLIHEFMHTLGYPDLYRVGAASGSSAEPVGLWDIMASNSYRLQYPLAYLRSHYTGWFTIPTVTEDVTGYSIYSATAATSATKNNQAIILKTDYSDTEFFVVEYRHTDDVYMSTAYDNYVYGSGLIVYRVNTKQDKNVAGYTDLIYVFRPGDSYDSYGHEAGLGDLTTSFLSEESGRTSYGSLDYEATLSEGAITYSDGTNSGILISNVGSATGDTITFDVTFGDGGESLGGFWNTETSKSASGLYSVDSCMDEAGNIYVVSGTTSSFQVNCYNETTGWSQVGSSVSVSGGYHKILLVGEDLYVACTDFGNNRINIYRYNNGWERVHRSDNEGTDFDIGTDGEKVYIAYTAPSYGDDNSVYCESYSPSSIRSLGVATSGAYMCNPILTMHNGQPVVIAREFSAGNAIHVSAYSSSIGSWTVVGGDLCADDVSAAVNGDYLYLMRNGDGQGNYENSYVYSMNLAGDNHTWSQLGTNTFTDNSAVPMSMFFDGDNIYITYQYGVVETPDVYVKTLIDNQWEIVGTKVTRDGIIDLAGAVNDRTIYLVYANNTSGITIKTHQYAEDADNVGGDSGSAGGDSGSGDTGNTGGSAGNGDSGSGSAGSSDTGTGDSGSAGGNIDSGSTGNTGSTEGATGGNSGESDGSEAEAFVAPDINVSYRTHIQTYGWEGEADDITTWESNGSMSGTSGESKRLEGINVVVNPATSREDLDLGIQYTTHCQNYGWLPWSADGDMNGTEGESKRLEAIMIQLTGEHAQYYDVYYRVHAQNYGWLGWAKDGEPAGTAGQSKRLEGIQIVITKKGEAFNEKVDGIASDYTEAFYATLGSSPIVNYPATDNENPVVPGEEDVNVAYRTHVQTYGWQGWKYNGQMSGTSGESKRLEGIEINLTNKDYSGGIAYTTHVQTYGWQGADLKDPTTWKRDGQMAGTKGESKRLEAICITLTGEMSDHYDIYYRVHAQTYGWLGWAKNGDPAGTAGLSRRLEGIQIVIVPKGDKAPDNEYKGIMSNDARAYISK